MTNDEAKQAMRAVLESHAVGTVLHLLSELVEEDAHITRREKRRRTH